MEPIQRVERFWSQRQKIHVLVFLGQRLAHAHKGDGGIDIRVTEGLSVVRRMRTHWEDGEAFLAAKTAVQGFQHRSNKDRPEQ